MTREECEKRIMGLAVQIADIYNEYRPDGIYLDITINNRNKDGDGCDCGDWDTRTINCNNAYYDTDKEKRIDFYCSRAICDDKFQKVYEQMPDDVKSECTDEWNYYQRNY